MIKIFNRLAWIASLAMGFVLAILIGIAFDSLDNRYAFDSDTLFVWLIATVVIGSIFKKLFLSKSFISLSLGAKEIIKTEKDKFILIFA